MHAPKPICPSSQVPELGSLPFKLLYRGEARNAILVRCQGVVYGYLNECAHMQKRLDSEHDCLFDPDGRYLRCSVHGVCYEPASGESASEICAGKKLTGLKVREEEGWVVLLEKRTELLPE